MSCTAKWITGGITLVLWGAWIAWCSEWEMNPDIGVFHIVVTHILRAAATAATIVLTLGIMVGPAIATARVWRDIGRREQLQQQDCRTAQVLPFRTMHTEN